MKDLIIICTIAMVFSAFLFIVCATDSVNTKMTALGPEQDRMYQELCELQEKNKNTENPNVQINVYIFEANND